MHGSKYAQTFAKLLKHYIGSTPQIKISQASGITQSKISRFLTGQYEPDFPSIVALAKAFGLRPDDFSNQILGVAPPRLEGRDEVSMALDKGIDEIPMVAEPVARYAAETVAEMTPAELEALVARASKRDNTINLENERLKKLNAELTEKLATYADAIGAWDSLDAATRALFLFLANKDSQLERVPPAILDPILKKLRSLEIRRPRKDHREGPKE